MINERFKNLIPSLSADEYSALESSILAHGCRDALVLWDGTIVDGHNRYAICCKHGIVFNTVNMDFASEDDACIWIIQNQFGRRNISDTTRIDLSEQMHEITARKAKERQGERTDLLSTSTKCSDPIHLRKEIAKSAGVGENKVYQWQAVKAKAPAEVIEKVRKSEISINQAYNEVKKEERKADIERQREEIKQLPIKPFDGKYDVLVVDPPWAYGREYDPESSRVANPYPEMSQDELWAIQLPASDNSILFLWTTHAFLFDAKALLDHWGYEHKAVLVWDKEKIGMGHWFRMQCEFCLVGIKGKPAFSNTTFRDIIREPRREHSRKPEAFYQMVESITEGSRIDYFAREQREGWHTYGNDQTRF